MRKSTIAIVLAAAAIFLAAARPAAAQRRPDTRPVKLAIDVSFINLFDQPKWMALGPELEIRLGPRFSLNPDVAVWIDQAFRGNARVNIVPGATANVRFGRFSFGAGAVRRVVEWSEMASGWALPKVQVGYLTGPTRLTAFALFLNTSDDIVIGMTISMGIGRPSRGSGD